MRLTISSSKIKIAKSSVVNKDACQRETLTKWPVRLPVNENKTSMLSIEQTILNIIFVCFLTHTQFH